MAADAVENAGMRVAELNVATAAALREKLPAAASVANPIDVLGDADPERYAEALDAAQDDDSVDAIIVILTPQAMTRPADTARTIARCLRGTKPVLASFMGGLDVMPGREELVEARLPDYPSPERAVAALKAMVDYTQWRRMPPRVVARFPVNQRRAERILHRCARTGELHVGEAAAKDIMRAYEFNVPVGRIVTDAEDAIDAAVKIGFPVAMKIASPDIIHKSDLGGVKLNLGTAEAVRDAYDLMMLRVSRRMPDARIQGAYLEKMCPRGREVILGMTRDPQFGPMLMFGLGGIFVEIMKDVTFHLAPVTAQEALEMLRSTKSYALLEGARGEDRVDISAIANCLQRLSQLVTDFPQIAEMDINPLIVGSPRQHSAGGRRPNHHFPNERSPVMNDKRSYDPDWQTKYQEMIMTPAAAVAEIHPGRRVFVGTGCAQPTELIKALTARAAKLPDTEIVHLLTLGDAPYADKKLAPYFRINSFFHRRERPRHYSRRLRRLYADLPFRPPAAILERPVAVGCGDDSCLATRRSRHVQPGGLCRYRQERGRKCRVGHRAGEPPNAAHPR